MPRGILWAVDFGQERVTALVVEPKSGSFRLLGSAQVPSAGMKYGEIENLGDVTESLVAVLRQAGKSSSLKCSAVFYNFDDAQLESRTPSGSRSLSGEGQILRADIDQAVLSAMRLVGHFEKSAVYSRPMHFLIDGKDSVVNPVGVFGRQLDVRMHVLLARAQNLENWKKVIRRAGLNKGTGVLSVLSSVYGCLDREERRGKRLVFDLGRDILNAVYFENGAISRYAGAARSEKTETADWVRAVCDSFKPGEGDVILTGDLAAENENLGRVCPPSEPGLPLFGRPEHSSAVGLLRLAFETSGRSASVSEAPHQWVHGLKQKASVFIQEYF